MPREDCSLHLFPLAEATLLALPQISAVCELQEEHHITPQRDHEGGQKPSGGVLSSIPFTYTSLSNDAMVSGILLGGQVGIQLSAILHQVPYPSTLLLGDSSAVNIAYTGLKR